MGLSFFCEKVLGKEELVCCKYTMTTIGCDPLKNTNSVLGYINSVQNKRYIGLVFICSAFVIVKYCFQFQALLLKKDSEELQNFQNSMMKRLRMLEGPEGISLSKEGHLQDLVKTFISVFILGGNFNLLSQSTEEESSRIRWDRT